MANIQNNFFIAYNKIVISANDLLLEGTENITNGTNNTQIIDNVYMIAGDSGKAMHSYLVINEN